MKTDHTDCKFNPGVDCGIVQPPASKCAKCGWNPDVAENRKNALARDLRAGKYPDEDGRLYHLCTKGC